MNQWTESLWGDEAFSAVAVMKSFWETMGVVFRDTSPPWFYITGWSWVRIFGSSEIALRSLTLLCIFGAALFAGLIVWEINKSKVSSVFSFLPALGAPFIFPFAFEWRMYALLCFATLGSVYFFVAKKWLWYIVFSLMAIYTHHFGLFTVAGEVVEWIKQVFGVVEGMVAVSGAWPFVFTWGVFNLHADGKN